jgi:hypothetical protein
MRTHVTDMKLITYEGRRITAYTKEINTKTVNQSDHSYG